MGSWRLNFDSKTALFLLNFYTFETKKLSKF